jgi:sulfoxide reductase heme-binding subunit YedZ
MRAVLRRLGARLATMANGWPFKAAVFALCTLPLGTLAIAFYRFLSGDADALGIDPVKTLEHQTGQDALGLLFITLAVTPIRRLFGINRVQAVRRMLGVWSFIYSLLHVCTYLVLDRSCYALAACDVGEIATDVARRKFILAGLTSFAILLALAITSTGGWVRRLRHWWVTLHRFVYVAAVAGVVHFVWIQKSDISGPLNWAGVLAALLGARVYFAVRKRQAVRPRHA